MLGSPLMTVKSLMNGTTEPTDMIVMCDCVMRGGGEIVERYQIIIIFVAMRPR